MSGATARPWGWSRDQETRDIVIHGPPYPEESDTSDIVLADGVYLSEDDAALIVRDHNAHDALVEALHWTLAEVRRAYGAVWEKNDWESYEPIVRARAALEEAKA